MKRTIPAAALILSEADRDELRALLVNWRSSGRDEGALALLAREIARAKIVSAEEVPPDVVTMQSRVQIEDLDSGEDRIYTLVYPWESDIHSGRLSILAPVGTALLGTRAGDVIEWPVPRGVRRIRVVRVIEQPEAPGDSRRERRA